MATLGFGTSLDKTKITSPWTSWMQYLQPQQPVRQEQSQSAPYDPNSVYGLPAGQVMPSGSYGVNGQPLATTPPTTTPQPPQPQNTGLSTVDRSQMSPYPTYFKSPDMQPGRKYVPGRGWVEVQTGADVTWDSATNQAYYRGVPISEGELALLYQQGPSAFQQTGYLDPQDVQTNLNTLGFGTLPNPIAPPTLGPATNLPPVPQINVNTNIPAPPTITAPRVTAEQGGFKDFDALERSIFESTYRPAERELLREQGLQDEKLAAQLAQAGIAASGTGVAQRADLAEEYSRRRIAAATDAVNTAAVQRYGMEYTQSMENAKLRQEANLANAGFSLQAQVENASNLLTRNIASTQLGVQAAIAQGQLQNQAAIAGAQIQTQRDIANANMYLQAMGLNFEQQNAARSNYLTLLGLQQQDLARMDDFELRSLELFYNTYLKEVAIMVSAGQVSYGKTDGSQSSTGIDTRIQL